MTFDEVYESYCLMLEQPHISIGDKDFDLEVEEFKDKLNDLVIRLSNVLKLIPVPNSLKKDRYVGNFVFDNQDQANDYWNELKNNFVFKNMIYFMFHISVEEISKLVGK